MIDGIPVFQGQVQVAVNADGQVISINEGLAIPDARIDTIPRLTESEGIQSAFLFSGRQAPASFEMIENRPAKGDRAVYRNPLGENRENILSEMRIIQGFRSFSFPSSATADQWNLIKTPEVKAVLSVNADVMTQQRREKSEVFFFRLNAIRTEFLDASLL